MATKQLRWRNEKLELITRNNEIQISRLTRVKHTKNRLLISAASDNRLLQRIESDVDKQFPAFCLVGELLCHEKVEQVPGRTWILAQMSFEELCQLIERFFGANFICRRCQDLQQQYRSNLMTRSSTFDIEFALSPRKFLHVLHSWEIDCVILRCFPSSWSCNSHPLDNFSQIFLSD